MEDVLDKISEDKDVEMEGGKNLELIFFLVLSVLRGYAHVLSYDGRQILSKALSNLLVSLRCSDQQNSVIEDILS